LATSGYKKKEDIFKSLPNSKKFLEKTISEKSETGDILIRGEYLFHKDFYQEALEKVNKTLKSKIGSNLKEISDSAGLSHEITSIIISDISAREVIIEKDGRLFAGGFVTEESLPDSKKKILQEAFKSAGDGLELDKIKDDFLKKDIKDLIKLGFLISLDGNIIYHKDIYNSMRDKIIALFDAKDKITVPEAKDAVGLSRKYILPLLNRIESDGLIKRLGDFRIKV
jgi:selenocysteine-specific elongation factor